MVPPTPFGCTLTIQRVNRVRFPGQPVGGRGHVVGQGTVQGRTPQVDARLQMLRWVRDQGQDAAHGVVAFPAVLKHHSGNA